MSAARAGRTPRAGRTVRALGALALATAGLAVAAPPAPAATGGVDGPTIALVAQPVGLELGGLATFTVRVTGAPADAEIDATVYPPATVEAVEAARQGSLPERQVGFVPRAPLTERTAADGTASVVMRVVDAPPRFAEEVRMGPAGVYPVRLRVLAAGGRTTLAQLVTFAVRPDATRRMPVTVVLPLPGTPALRADGTTSVAPADQARAEAVTGLLAALPDFPFTLAPRPELLNALGRTNPVLTDRLATSLGTRAVLAMPFVRLDVSGMVAADLGAEVGRQLAAGEQATAQALPGARPDRRVWLADGPLDDAALAGLRTLGVQHLLVRPDQLDPAPAEPVLHPLTLNVGGETKVLTDDGRGLGALVGDAALAARLSQTDDITATVVDLVARLSARAFTDEVGRGLVIVPPADWTVVPAFWRALDSALRGPGMVKAVSLDEFLRVTTMERATVHRLPTVPARDELGLAQSLFVTRVALTQMGAVLPPASDRFAGLTDRTTIATSADLTDAERQAYFDAVTERVNPVRGAVTVTVRDRIITLAGKEGTVPLSLVNALDEPVSVRLRVSTDKLRVTDNDRLVVVPAKGELALRLEVQARTSAWQFPVTVELTTPDGSEPIGTPTRFDLRAVGLSGLGLGLSFGLLAVLATWWISHHRRRRRAARSPTTTLVSP